jgi:hypothetical protein
LVIPLVLATINPGEYSETVTLFLDLGNQLVQRDLIVSGTTLGATSEF